MAEKDLIPYIGQFCNNRTLFGLAISCWNYYGFCKQMLKERHIKHLERKIESMETAAALKFKEILAGNKGPCTYENALKNLNLLCIYIGKPEWRIPQYMTRKEVYDLYWKGPKLTDEFLLLPEHYPLVGWYEMREICKYYSIGRWDVIKKQIPKKYILKDPKYGLKRSEACVPFFTTRVNGRLIGNPQDL